MREINNQIIDPVRIADAFCRQHPQMTANIEQVRLMKGKAFPDWPYWCFLPITRWLMLFMGGQKREFTPAVWLEIQKLSVLGTWRYSKGIYTPHPSLLNALAERHFPMPCRLMSFYVFPNGVFTSVRRECVCRERNCTDSGQ
ncbi:TPA: hypothetical protein ACXEXC_000904 [Citrobacter freundii]